jgi:hypothetical protein
MDVRQYDQWAGNAQQARFLFQEILYDPSAHSVFHEAIFRNQTYLFCAKAQPGECS